MNLDQAWVLLEDRLGNKLEKNNLLFSEPVDEFLAFNQDELVKSFQRMQQASQSGFYVVGYVAYEAAYYLHPSLNQFLDQVNQPLLHFFAFRCLEKMSEKEVEVKFQNNQQDYSIRNIQLLMNECEYQSGFRQIQKYLLQGDSYQVNFTNKYQFDFDGDAFSFYLQLREQQKVSYGGYLHFGEAQILSCSPELFLQKKGDCLFTKPMKGTIARHYDAVVDQEYQQQLRMDEKLRSENLIIVDLLRNDLSVISRSGTVEVVKLLEIESYQTLHQMTSSIQSNLKDNLSMFDIFKAMFPCGSITGAPKMKTMQIIHELEKEARNLYTGSIGYIMPNSDFCFNVAIRSIYITNNKGELGIGGGLIYESDAKQEFEETKLKARFFVRSIEPAMLLFESILWQQDAGFYLLDEHIERLKSSAYELGFEYSEDKIRFELAASTTNLKHQPYKIQLFLSRNGEITTKSQVIQLASASSRPKVGLYLSKYLNSHHPLLAYKIFNSEVRRFYQDARQQYPEFWDLIFVNERQEITETSIGNIVLEIAGENWTPPLSSGLLPGIMRSKLKAKERPLFIKDLREADKIWVVNSVRGMQEVELCPKSY